MQAGAWELEAKIDAEDVSLDIKDKLTSSSIFCR